MSVGPLVVSALKTNAIFLHIKMDTLSRNGRMDVKNEDLPIQFQNVIVENSDTLIIIRSNLKSITDMNGWVTEFGRKTNTNWISRDSCPSGERFVCWKKFVCHHSSFNKASIASNRNTGLSKNSKCPASLKIKVKVDTCSSRKNDNFVKQGLVAVVTITPFHNHTINTAETLRFLPAVDCREKFLEYFDDGMGIAESAKYHKEILQMLDNFNEVDMANSRINQTVRTIRYWYDQWRLFNLGPRTGPDMIAKLREKILTYEEQGSLVHFNEAPFAVSIVTPLMRRASNLETAADIVFVDSTSSCDAENHSITFFLTPCAAGAVPLGIIITKGQTEVAYTTGFKLLKNSLGKPFNRNNSPTIFMTDNSRAEINSLSSVWPGCENLLCIFHVGQAVWRWLWDSKHCILKEHRAILMGFFQRILYASSPEEAANAYLNAQGCIGAYLPIYANWIEYVSEQWISKEKWCLAFRDERVRGHHTNNFSEISVRIFKDHVLSRVKAYNIITLLDFCATVMERYYCNRLTEFANNRNSALRLFLLSLKKKAAYLQVQHIEKLDENTFLVPSEKGDSAFTVNIKSGCCTCNAGMFGKLCKHQYAAYHLHNIELQNCSIAPKVKHQIACLALGERAPPLSFYQPLLLEVEEASISNNSEVMTNEVESRPTVEIPEQQIRDLDCPSVEINDIFIKIIKVQKDLHNRFGSSSSGLQNFYSKLNKISSEGQWEEFLHTACNRISLRHRAGASIHVQPTSIARRSLKVTRGSKRLPSGRPASGVSVKRKRSHSLCTNIKLNQPNAKMHGLGH